MAPLSIAATTQADAATPLKREQSALVKAIARLAAQKR
jgi:hypothetical protein